jgi:beta-glucosidase
MRPEKELKAFKKVFLQPGETQVVAMNIKVADLAFYDEKIKDWNVEPGKFVLQLGNSSKNILQTTTIEVR